MFPTHSGLYLNYHTSPIFFGVLVITGSTDYVITGLTGYLLHCLPIKYVLLPMVIIKFVTEPKRAASQR